MWWRIRFSAIVHLQKASITAISENVPDSQSTAYRRKYQNKQNFLSAHTWEKNYLILLNQSFDKYLEPCKEIKVCVVKTIGKYWTGVIFGNLIRIFME